MVPQGLVVLFPVVLGGDLWEPFVVLWDVIPLPNS
jgi:hypothetical protein